MSTSEAARPAADGSRSRRPQLDAFIGRADELSVLRAQLDHVVAGSSRVVLIEGQAGIGKSALVRQFLVGTVGVRILHASGDEEETRLPYGVISQLFAGLDSSPGARSWLQAGGSDAREDPPSVGARLLELLGVLQDEAPVVVVLDDAHWADTSSLQALTFALRRLDADRVLALVASREEASNVPEGLRRLVRSERGTVVHLRGLNPRQLIDLAARLGLEALPQRVGERLFDHTGGNPLYARALLEELDRDSLVRSSSTLPAPRSFAELVWRRLSTTSTEAARLVEAASVLGQRCRLDLAARLADVDHVSGPLGEAVTARLLDAIEAPTGWLVAFPHPLVRAAVYHGLGPARRSSLHACAAGLLERPASLHHRVAAALVEDQALAAEVEAHAREEAGRGAMASGAAHLASAARLSVERGERERLLVDAVEHLLLAGEVAEATVLADELAGLADSARRSYVLGHLAFLAGRPLEAEELLTAAWHRCDRFTDSRLAARISAVLAHLQAGQARISEQIEWARRSLAASADTDVGMFRLGVLVVGLGLAGRADEGLALVDSLPEVAQEADRTEADGLLGRGLVRLWTDDLAGARADLSAVVAACRRAPASRLGLVALGHLGNAEYRLGAWDDSVIHAGKAASLATDADLTFAMAGVHAIAGFVPACRGDWDAAEAHARASREAASSVGDVTSAANAATAEAQTAFCRGDHAQVVEAVQPILAINGRGMVDVPGVLPWRELYAEALVHLGRLSEADDVLSTFERLAEKHRVRSCLASAARLRGELEAARGSPSAARAAFETALGHAAEVPVPFSRALLAFSYGRFLRRAGQRRAASEHLRTAHDGFSRLGANPFLERCERELAACGLTPRRRTTPVTPALTPQELAVATLVAAGRTNREVAAELVLSVKTVEYHLGHVYAKLGMTSRSQLAAHFAARASAPPGPYA